MFQQSLRLWVGGEAGLAEFMRTFLSILALVALASAVLAGDSRDRPLLSFSLTATNQSFSYQFLSGLTLRVERDSSGWEVGVFKHDSEDNLLYPQHNWHGAFPCQLYPWSHRTKIFPEERLIPIRGRKGSVRIRLLDAGVAGEPGSERFTGGRVEIYCRAQI